MFWLVAGTDFARSIKWSKTWVNPITSIIMHKVKPYKAPEQKPVETMIEEPPYIPVGAGDVKSAFLQKWMAENSSKYTCKYDRMLACCKALEQYCEKENIP